MSTSAPLAPDEAWSLLEPHLETLPATTARRQEACWRVLAEPIRAEVDVPPARVSAMDGYAIGGPPPGAEPRPVCLTVRAGDAPGAHLDEGTAARIMTGAPVPTGADRVVPVESTDGGERQVRFEADVGKGDHIRERGEILRAGAPLLPAGSLLTPGSLSLLATHGLREVPVVRAPTVATLATGNEVVPPERVPEPGQLRDSHSDFFAAALHQLGCAVSPLGIAADDPASLRERVGTGLAADVLLLSGGVSMGAFDFVEAVLADAGCHLLFDAVAIQPGKPMVAARHPDGLVFALPGNPASAMVTFWLFVRPALRRLQGLHDRFWHGAIEGRLEEPLPGAKGRDRFFPARVDFERGSPRVCAATPRGSHDIGAYGQGTALVRIPAHSPPTAAGERCEILPLADWPVPVVDALQRA